jgi:hypothetical protein
MTNKQKRNDNIIIGIIIGIVLFSLLQYILIHVIGVSVREVNPPENISQNWSDVGGNIDIEYYLEVSEDSVWIENYNTHKVYGGKYSQLDSLIIIDNQ